MTDGPNNPETPANLLGEQIIELKDGLNTFQSTAFETLYDKKVQWAKDDTQPTASADSTENSVAVEEVKNVENPEDIIDEAPVARKRIVEAAVTEEKPVVVTPVEEVTIEAVAVKTDPVVPISVEPVTVIIKEEKSVEIISAPVAGKKSVVAEVKKSGGFFGFLQSDSAVQQIANTNKPTQPPAIAKAFMTPTPAETIKEVKKEAPVRKSKEGLNMVMYKQDEDSEEKKAMMSSRPSLADFKASAAKDAAEEEEDDEEEEVQEARAAPRIPTGAPIKAPAPIQPKSGGMFSFLSPPPQSKVESIAVKEEAAPAKAVPQMKEVAPKLITKEVSAVVPAPKAKTVVQVPPPPPKKPAAPNGFFNFLTSDPSLVAPGDANAKPSGPPAVARAFMSPTPAEARKEGEVMSAAALIRQAEFEQDVKDEEIKSAMMAARPSIGAARAEASKTPSKAEIRAAEAKAAGRAVEVEVKPSGLFDFFSLDQGASGGDIYEPRDPNALTAKEESAFSAPPPVKGKTAVPMAKKSAPAPVIKAPIVKAAAPSGGLFGFLNPSTSAPAKETTVAATAKKVAPAVAPAAIEKVAATPSGGLFGFLNQAPVKTTTVVAKIEEPAPAAKSAPAASGGVFGFLNSAPAKASPVTPVAKKITPPAAAVKTTTVVAKIVEPAPIAKSAPAASGGVFGFLNSAPAKASPVTPVAKKITPPAAATKAKVTAASPAPVVSTSSEAPAGGFFGFLNSSPTPTKVTTTMKPSVAVGMNVKFLASISKLLKGDAQKIKAFQTATDSFRSGDVPSEAFLKTLENLFGTDNLESVVIPLVSELPERTVATKLKAAYDKKTATLKKAAEPAKKEAFSFPTFGAAPAKKVVAAPVPVVVAPPAKKDGFSFPTFGAAPAKKVVAAPVPVVVAPPAKKDGFSFPTFGAAPAKKVVAAPVPVVVAPPAKKDGFSFPSFGAPKVAAPAVVPLIKLPASVPASKKVVVESQVKQLLSGAIDAKVFYKNISKDLGRPKTLEVLPELIKSLPKPIGIKVEAVLKADK